jgi:hypothetical protein
MLMMDALQVRLPVPEVASVVRALIDGTTAWSEVTAKYPAVVRKDDEEGGDA